MARVWPAKAVASEVYHKALSKAPQGAEQSTLALTPK